MYHRAAIMRVDDRVEPAAPAIPNDYAGVTIRRRSSRPRLRKSRRWRLIAAAVVLVVLLGAGGATAYAYASVKNQAAGLETTLLVHLQSGQTELEAARASLSQANATHDENQVNQAKVHFANARAQFLAASQTADHSTLLHQLEGLPVVGTSAKSRHTAVDAVAAMGVQLSLAGEHLTTLAGELLKPAGGGQEGQRLLSIVGQVQTEVVPVVEELNSALRDADNVDLSVLPASQRATFQRARGSIGLALNAVKQFQALVPIMNEVLGGNGARTYLIEQVNPAELRPGGGFIGTYSVLRADHGALSLIASGPASTLVEPRPLVGQPGYVQPPGPIRELIPDTSWSFIDSNFSADFSVNAQTAETFVQSRLGHVDAVISIDYYTIAKFLELTGPIAVPGYGITLTSQTFIPLEVNYDIAGAGGDAQAGRIHYAILAATAGPLLQRIVTLQPSQWPALIGALNDLAASRHLQTYFNNPDVQKATGQYGWSGVLKPKAAGDYMMEVEANLGGTKANFYVTRHYTVALTHIGNYLHHEVTVDIRDDMPYGDRPSEYYRAYLRMFIGDQTFNSGVDMARPKYGSPAPPAGTKQMDGWIQIHGYGHTRSVTFYWDTPWQPSGRGVEQIYWQKQPGTQADKVDVIWNDGHGHTYKTSGDLGQDRVITLAPNGVSLLQGQVGTAQLPSLSLG